MIQEDKYWRQRAKIHWYRVGDMNTKFFHASTTSKKKVNHITSLENDVGDRVSNKQGMCLVARSYFEDLCLEKNSSRALVVKNIDKVVSDEDNIFLTNHFQVYEFKEAMFSMRPYKCPSPDGFNPGFFFNIFGRCVVLIFFSSGMLSVVK